MVQKLFDSYVFLYIMGIISAIGILIKLCLFLGYCSLIRASDSMSSAKKKWIKQMKLKFETCYQLKIGVNNVDTFVDKYVSKRKFCGILLSTWENISGQAVSLCLLTASCSGILGIVYDCGKDIVLFTFFAGAFVSVVVVIVDNVVNITDHKKLLYLNLKDYFENYLKVRLEREHFYPEQLQQYQKEYFNSLDESNLQVAAAKEGEAARNSEENKCKTAEQVSESNVVVQNKEETKIEISKGNEIHVTNGNLKNELKKTKERFQKKESNIIHKPSNFDGKNGNKNFKNNHENLLHNSKAERRDKFTGEETRSELFSKEEKKSATALAKKEDKEAAGNEKKESKLSSKKEKMAKKEAKKAAAIQEKENKRAAQLGKQEAKKAAILKKKEDKKEAVLAAKEAKKAEKLEDIYKKEAAKKAKIEAIEQKKADKRLQQEKKVALKDAIKKEKLDLINAKKDAVEKQKQEAIQAKLLKKEELSSKKEEQAKVKEEAKKQKEEKPSHQQRAYQLKMQLIQEKELELKNRKEESLNRIEAHDVYEKNDQVEPSKVITLHNKVENEISHNPRFSLNVNEKILEKDATVNNATANNTAVNNVTDNKTEKNLNQKAGKSPIQKSEEDKLIEEVLREFLA